MAYLKQVSIAVDQLLNALSGGYADETLSARAWRTEYAGKMWGRILRPVIDALFFFDPDHCRNSFLSEVDRLHFPPAYRK